jgi:hypothetical protein
MPVFFGNDGFLQQGRYLLQFSLHPPFLVLCQEGVHNLSLIIRDDGGIFNFIRQGKYPVQDKEKQDKPDYAYAQPFEEKDDSFFGDPEL